MKIHQFYSSGVYMIESDEGEAITSTSNLEEAALILRYLTGANMPDADAARALAIMARIDEENRAKQEKKKAKKKGRTQAAAKG